VTVTAQTWAAVDQALRELVLGEIGTIRTVASTRFLLGVHEDRPAEQFHRSIERARIEITIEVPEFVPLGSVYCGTGLEGAEIEITTTRASTHEVLDVARHQLRALALDDLSVLRDALTYPGNLTATLAGVATGLVSGCLVAIPGGDQDYDSGRKLLTTKARFKATLERALAT